MISVTQELITPERASTLLLKNPHNRKISNTLVVQYTQLMQRGEWKFNGDPIRVNGDGSLIDGQHRLSAIVASGQPQRCVVISGLESDAFKTIDCGKKRSTGDMLSIRGYGGAVHGLAAAGRALLVYETGVYWNSKAQRIDWSPTSSQIIDYIDSHPDVASAFYKIQSDYTYALKLLGNGPATLSLVLMRRTNPGKAEEFMTGVETGVTDGEGDPRHILRETLARLRIGTFRTMRYEETAAFVIKAMNAFFGGKPLKILRFKKNESFPKFEPTKI